MLAGFAAFVVLVLAISASAAFPPDLTDTFDSGDDGWSIYEGGSIGPADWYATGGNPGGFLSHTSSEGDSGAAFGDAGYVAHLSRYFGRARIVADIRSTAAAPGPPIVRLVDPTYPAFGSISSSGGEPLSTQWRHYSFPLRPSAGWYDESGDRLGSGDLRHFLNLDPVILVDADYGSGAGERIDLDNIGLISEWPRGISIKPKKNGFKGVITIKEGHDAPQCLDSQKVRVLRERKRGARLFGKAKTDADGKYVIKGDLKRGRYFAQAPLTPQPTGPPCGAARSKTIKVKP